MAWIRPRSRSFSFRPMKPRSRSATRRRMPISPPDRSTARSPRMRSRRRHARAARRPSSRSMLAEAIAQNHPMYESSEIPAGGFGGSPARPDGRGEDDQLRPPHRCAQRSVGIDRRRLYPAVVRDPADGDGGVPAGARRSRHPDTDKDAVIPVHPGAAALRRRRGKDLPGPLQRFHLVGADGSVRHGLRPARGSRAI